MKRRLIFLFSIMLFVSTNIEAQKYIDISGKVNVSVVTNPYHGDRRGPEISDGPAKTVDSGLLDLISRWGGVVTSRREAGLTDAEEKEYGVRNRFGHANRNLGELVAENEKNRVLNVGIFNNCNSLTGMLAGMQNSGLGWKPLRVGFVWIDAHADYNTPETTLSGMLGGMPVAVATGDCLWRLRVQSGLNQAIPERYVVMAGVRDTDPLEQERLDRSMIEQLSVDDLINVSDNLHKQMKRLSELTDIIYIHVDMDVLDPVEVMGHSLAVPGGPTSIELAKAISAMFSYDKVASIGIASIPSEDKDNLSQKAAYNLIEGAISAVKKRETK